jgi:hypothetical protein
MLTKERVQEEIKQAIEFVEDIDEPYRSLAFSVVLYELIHDLKPHPRRPFEPE